MKKMLFCAAVAIAALASCSKTHVVYNDAPEEIAFKQITGVMTKTGGDGNQVDGGNGQGTTGDTPAASTTNFLTGDMGVFAVYGNDEYFENIQFTKQTDATPWTGNPAQYYPLSGTLDFVGYAPYIETPEVEATATESTDEIAEYDITTQTLTISNFDNTDGNCTESIAQPSTLEATETTSKVQRDLLYSDYIAGVGKTTATQPMNLNHALAQIVVNVKLEGEGSLTINSLVVKDTYQTGKLDVTYTPETSGNTTTYAAEPNWTSGLDEDEDILWPTYDYAVQFDQTTLPFTKDTEQNSAVTMNQTGSAGFYVIPGDQTEMVLTYKLGDSTTEITHTFDLNPTTPMIQWEAGKKYTYNIIINNNEIKFNATVAEWADNSYTTTVDYANNTPNGSFEPTPIES